MSDPPCTSEGTFASDASYSSYIVCTLQQTLVSCPDGMVFSGSLKECVLPDCRSATSAEKDSCGSFDCSDKELNYCLGSHQFDSGGAQHTRFGTIF
jgi:hypothetical protein